MIEIEPKEFWDDMKWGRVHYSELVRKYPDKWIAIVDKKVISSGESIKKIRKEAMEKTGRKHIPVIFVEFGAHVYKTLV